MLIHDWSRVTFGICHDFHLTWMAEIRNFLNGELLPTENYALAEQTTTMPSVNHSVTSEIDDYVRKRRNLVIRHCEGDRVVALLEMVSPSYKASGLAQWSFVDHAARALHLGHHLAHISRMLGAMPKTW